MSTKVLPINGCIVLKPVEQLEQMVGQIIIPDLGHEKPEMGEVVAVSDTYNYHKGEYIQSNLSEGDNVLIPKMGTQKIVLDGEDYFIVKETDILAIVKK